MRKMNAEKEGSEPSGAVVVGALAIVLGLSGATACAAAGDGLAAVDTAASWSQWQGRVNYAATTPIWRSGLGGFESGGFTVKRGNATGSLSLLGDYYFATGSGAGGFRATSGLIIGPRSQLSVSQPGLEAGGLVSLGGRPFGASAPLSMNDPANDTASVPYVGLGYTGLSGRSGWSFSADLGMAGPGSSNAATRLFGSGARVGDDNLHDMRFTPLLKVGVLYSF